MSIPGEIGLAEAGMRRSIAKMRANEPINGLVVLDCQSATINRFIDEAIAAARITQTASVMGAMGILRFLALWTPKPFLEHEKEDFISFFANRVNAGGISNNIRVIKGFCNWLYKLPKKTYPPCINWLGPAPRVASKVKPKDILTPEEIKAILKACDTQDKARFGIHIEGGARSKEVHYMQKSDVEPAMFAGRFGYRLTFHSDPLSKTKAGGGSFRVVPIVIMAPYLTDWINIHPNWDTQPDPYLWCNSMCGTKLGHGRSWYQKMKRVVRRAGITKNFYPHLCRHTKGTEMSRLDLPEGHMRTLMGWSPTSPMPSRYTHLSGKKTEDAALRTLGLEISPEKPMFKLDNICPACDTHNPLHATICVACSAPLDEREYLETTIMHLAGTIANYSKRGFEVRDIVNKVIDFLDEKKKPEENPEEKPEEKPE